MTIGGRLCRQPLRVKILFNPKCFGYTTVYVIHQILFYTLFFTVTFGVDFFTAPQENRGEVMPPVKAVWNITGFGNRKIRLNMRLDDEIVFIQVKTHGKGHETSNAITITMLELLWLSTLVADGNETIDALDTDLYNTSILNGRRMLSVAYNYTNMTYAVTINKHEGKKILHGRNEAELS